MIFNPAYTYKFQLKTTKGFIHRDIKPHNVLVAIPDPDAPDKWEKAVAKLADFATVKRFIKSVFS